MGTLVTFKMSRLAVFIALATLALASAMPQFGHPGVGVGFGNPGFGGVGGFNQGFNQGFGTFPVIHQPELGNPINQQLFPGTPQVNAFGGPCRYYRRTFDGRYLCSETPDQSFTQG